MKKLEIPSFEPSDFPLCEQLPADYLTWALGSLITQDQVSPARAVLVIENALKFVKGAADHEELTIAPSPLVDAGWHRLWLLPRKYILHNLDTFGKIVWHEPVMDEQAVVSALSPAQTFELLGEWGESPDPDIWFGKDDKSSGLRCDTCVEKVWSYDLSSAA